MKADGKLSRWHAAGVRWLQAQSSHELSPAGDRRNPPSQRFASFSVVNSSLVPNSCSVWSHQFLVLYVGKGVLD